MTTWVREPAVAGHFYPGSRQALQKELERCMGDAVGDEEARVIIGPHAGTMYSGTVAGALYSRVRIPERCIVLAPNHTGRGKRMSLWPRGSWRLPTGEIPVDEALCTRISHAFPDLEEDRGAHQREHALELHLPFLLVRQPKLRIVPITLSWLELSQCRALGRALAQVVSQESDPILIVASTDMSHHIPGDEAKALDELALRRVKAVDPAGLYETVASRDISMCGVIPTTVALAAARSLGCQQAELIQYANSGDISGDQSSVVGYAALKI